MKFHWAIYGQHKEGHAILAQSGVERIAERLARFTDRPGDPPAGACWTSATSGFVFEDHFVLLRTIPDNSGRPGMVQSFAVFIPVISLETTHSLQAVLALLPSEIISIPAKVMPLELPDENNVPQSQGTLGLTFIIERLAAIAPKLPLIWGMAEDYIPTIDTIWGRIPSSLKAGFSFTFHFEPGNKFPTQPQIVATLPILTSRWPLHQIIPQDGRLGNSVDDAVRWFIDGFPTESYRRLVSDYGLHLTTFQGISHLARFATIVAKHGTLEFSDLTLAVRIISALGIPSSGTKYKSRMTLFEHLYKKIPFAAPDEILKLRNLPEKGLPEFIPQAQTALLTWISNAGTHNAHSCVPILEEAVDDLEGWWSIPFLKWLREISSRPSVSNALILVAFFETSVKLARHLISVLPRTLKWEPEFLKVLPTPSENDNLLTLAEEYRWLLLHASILANEGLRPNSLSKHAQLANGALDGYNVFLSRWGYPEFLRIADAAADRAAIRCLAMALPLHSTLVGESNFRSMKMAGVFWADVLSLRELDPVITGLITRYVNDNSDTDIGRQLLIIAPSAVFDVECLELILGGMKEDEKATLARWVTDAISASLFNNESIDPIHSSVSELLISQDILFDRIDNTTIDTLGTFVVATFEQLTFLSDEQFSERLKNLFTRTAAHRISGDTADRISALLMRAAFPKSAEVVFDTAEKYFRNDVKPIAMTIKKTYDQDRMPSSANNAKVKKLIPVLIATALTLERDAIVGHLGDLKYNPKLKFDSGVWPANEPQFEVFVIITGQGNLPTQRLVADIAKRIKPEFAFFVGVSGALKDGFSVGDVAYSTKVYYVEGGREDNKRVASRPEQEPVDENLVQLTHRVAGAFQRIEGQASSGSFDVKDAVIASGAKVLTSKAKNAANFQNVRANYNDSSIIELEGYGFMVAARTSSVKFSMVIRGVSDGCEGKDPTKDQQDQPTAARNAALFLFTLLKQCPTLMSSKKQKRFFGELLQSFTDFLAR